MKNKKYSIPVPENLMSELPKHLNAAFDILYKSAEMPRSAMADAQAALIGFKKKRAEHSWPVPPQIDEAITLAQSLQSKPE